jgi:hypothetical protein
MFAKPIVLNSLTVCDMLFSEQTKPIILNSLTVCDMLFSEQTKPNLN